MRCGHELADRQAGELGEGHGIRVFVPSAILPPRDHESEDIDVLVGGAVLSDVVAPDSTKTISGGQSGDRFRTPLRGAMQVSRLS